MPGCLAGVFPGLSPPCSAWKKKLNTIISKDLINSRDRFYVLGNQTTGFSPFLGRDCECNPPRKRPNSRSHVMADDSDGDASADAIRSHKRKHISTFGQSGRLPQLAHHSFFSKALVGEHRALSFFYSILTSPVAQTFRSHSLLSHPLRSFSLSSNIRFYAFLIVLALAFSLALSAPIQYRYGNILVELKHRAYLITGFAVGLLGRILMSTWMSFVVAAVFLFPKACLLSQAQIVTRTS